VHSELVGVIHGFCHDRVAAPSGVLNGAGSVNAMPVFDAKNLDSEFEGHGFLAAILHPSQEAQARALTRGRNRAARPSMIADPRTLETRFPSSPRRVEIEAEAT
jgi:hypothetical protein